jgi:hypothetical protein
MLRPLSIFILATSIAACTTSIEMTDAADHNLPDSLAVSGVSVLPATDLSSQLEREIRAQAETRFGADGEPVEVNVLVKKFQVFSGTTRFLAGALVGSNHFVGDVTVIDPATNETLLAYSVTRKENPGGYGMFYNQQEAIIRKTASEILDAIVEAQARN